VPNPLQSDNELLANLLAVTDHTLTRLSVEDLEIELLSRIRTILDADTASILLRDEASDTLVAHASSGLEEEVREGFRLPFGAGFAGSIAARRRPVMLDRVDETTVVNPVLWEKGLHSMLGVPLISEDDVIGVLHVGRLDGRPFEQDDVALLEIAAERVAGATIARRLAIEAAASGLLERSLMPPTRFPILNGIEFAGRYVATESRRIGGDWYDAFTLPDGTLWLLVGDVVGHGLTAAVVMGRVRSALRSYALLGGGPAEVLELADRKVQHFEIGTMVTVLAAVATPPYEQFRLASAGHPAPIRAAPGETSTLAPITVGPPLGAFPDITRKETCVDLPLGAVLLLYTDGLVERRGASIYTGIEKLRVATGPEHPELVCRTVMHRMIGGLAPDDDIAVLAVRRTARQSSD
jgi:phosphoserine phosphatase RsbU/P